VKVASKAIIATKDSVLDAIEDGGRFIEQCIDNPRVPARPLELPGWIKKIFNNPFTRLLSKINPLGWVLEALYEEMPELKLPDISRLIEKFSTVFTSAFEGTASLLQQLWESLFKQILIATSDPAKIFEAILNALKSVFWNFWDTATLLIEKTFDCLSIFLDELGPLLMEEWNIPGLTDMWEDLTEQKFSVLGFVTFAPAAIINMSFAITEGRIPELGPVDFGSTKMEPFYKSTSSGKNRKLQSLAREGEVGTVSDLNAPVFNAVIPMTQATALKDTKVTLKTQHPVETVSKQMRMTNEVPSLYQAATIFPNLTEPALNATKGNSVVDTPKADETEDDWAMPHWFELVFEDVGKTYSGFWNSFDSIVTAVADYRSYQNPQLPPVAPGTGPAIELGDMNTGPAAVIELRGPRKPEVASRWWIFFRSIGKLLQGGALIFNAVASTRNTLTKEKNHNLPKISIFILGVCELECFVASMVVPAFEEIFGIIGDCCGSSGTVLRCIDDNSWDVEAWCETISSIAVVVKIVADQAKKKDVEPVTKVCIAAASVGCAFTDTGGSIFGLVKCVEKCVEASKNK
jgi:hypothetical protein